MKVVINQNIEIASSGISASRGFYCSLLTALAHDKSISLAAMLAELHGIEGRAVILSPVHWQASHNDAMVMAEGHELGLKDESFKLFDCLKSYFELSGYQMLYHDENHWLLYAENLPRLDSIAVYDMPGKAMMPILEKLDRTMHWPKVITECQMLLTQEKVNQLRSEKGLPAINGIWVWGEGTLSRLEIKVVAQKKYLPLANTFSNQVVVLDENQSVKKTDLLLVDSIEALTIAQLDQLNKLNRQLYYNNAIVEKKKIPLWKRIFTRGAV